MSRQTNPDFGDMASDFDRLFKGVWELTQLEATSLNHVFENYGVKTVLDCAAGTGIQSLGLAEMGYKMYASDISVEMLRRLEEKATSRQLEVTTKRADFQTLDEWKGWSFDAVICCGNSLPLLPNTASAKMTLKSMINVTKRPHGVGVVGLHNYIGPGLRKNRLVFRGASLDRHGLELRMDLRGYSEDRVEVNYHFIKIGSPHFQKVYRKSYLLLDPKSLRDLMLDCGYKSVRILDRRGLELSDKFEEFPLVVGET